MKVTDFWQDIDPEHNRLYYVMEFVDMDDRNARFAAFRNDPEWQQVRAGSEKNGPIVERVVGSTSLCKKEEFFL